MAGWRLAFSVLALLTAVLIGLDGGAGGGRRAVAIGLLVVLCGWYAATVGRPAASVTPGLGPRYLALAGPITVALFALQPVGALMLFVLYPYIWTLLPFRWAVAGTAATVASVSAVLFARSAGGAGALVEVTVLAAVSLLVAVMLGLWFTRIVEQSGRRARLVAELEATRASRRDWR